jgi:formate-dependent nitrite reductase membrane component NrfD
MSDYYGLPLLKAPVWTWEVPAYFFVGGAAGASAVIANAAKLAGGRDDLVRDARWIAAAGSMLSAPLLIADLGRPERFLNMLRVFKLQSPMSVGVWTLVAFSSSAAAAAFAEAVASANGDAVAVRLVRDAADALAAATGVVLSTYTGVLIGATAIPVWSQNVRLLPIHFGASGIGAAASLLELMGHRDPALNLLAAGAAAVETLIGAGIELRERGARAAEGKRQRHDHAAWRISLRSGAARAAAARRRDDGRSPYRGDLDDCRVAADPHRVDPRRSRVGSGP